MAALPRPARATLPGVHLHAYLVTGLRAASIPPREKRPDWEPDDVFSEAAPAVEWLANATRELCAAPEMNLADEISVWTTNLDAGESVHTGARETSILVEAHEDCDCGRQDGGSIAPLRRTRRR
jgi:hypothetical protein